MADLAGSKIQIMNGAGTNLFPRNRTIDIVDKAGNAVFDATTQQVKAAYLPSYVDDVLEVQYLGSGTLPTFASASHANKWMFSTSNNKMYSGSTTAWVQKDWETGKIYIDVDDDKVEGTYRWTGAKPVKITEAPIATTGDVRPWTVSGTAEDTLVPTELAVANAINAGVTSAITKTKADIGKVVNTIAATNPVGRNVSTGNVTLSLNYGTTLSNGVALKLDNTTSLIAYAQTANGVSTTIGTVVTLPTALASTNDLSTVFGLSGHASTIASANTYVVPTFKLFVDVTSKINTIYGKAVSTITGDTNGNRTINFTRVDGTTGSFKYTDTNTTYAKFVGATSNATTTSNGVSGLVPQPISTDANKFLKGDGTWAVPANTTYGHADGAGTIGKLVGTSQIAASLDTATLFGLNTVVVGNADTLSRIVPTLGTLSMVTSALTSRINKAVADKGIGVAWLSGAGIAKVYKSGTTTEAQAGNLVVSVTSAYADAAGNAISTFTKPTGANKSITFTRYNGGTGTLSYVDTTYGAATTASQGLVKLTNTSAALQYGATGTTVLTQEELNRSIKTYLVTSIFATSAAAVAGITNSMKVDHPNEYVAAETGEIYQVISTGASTVSAKLIVGAGDQHLLIKTDNNTVSGGNARLLAFVKAADSAGSAGDAGTLGGKSADELLVSSAVSAGTAGTASKLGTKTEGQLLVSSAVSAGTAANANSLGGTAAGTIKKAFSSVSQTGTSMVFKALDNTLTSHEVTSALYAKTAGGVAWGNVTGKPTIVNTVKGMNGVGISGNISTGNVVVSGINATDAAVGVVQLAGGRLTSNNAIAGKDVITQSRLDVERIIHEVTSLFATDASAITAAGGAGSGHAGHFFAGNTKLYKVVMKDATTTSAQEVGALGGLPFVLSNAVASQNGNLYVSRGGQYRPVVTSINQGSNVTVVNNNDGTFTISAKDTTYAAATLAEILASSGTNKFMRPDSYGAAQLGTLTTGATTTNAGLAATTSKGYVPTAYAVLNQCLFYSTIA